MGRPSSSRIATTSAKRALLFLRCAWAGDAAVAVLPAGVGAVQRGLPDDRQQRALRGLGAAGIRAHELLHRRQLSGRASTGRTLFSALSVLLLSCPLALLPSALKGRRQESREHLRTARLRFPPMLYEQTTRKIETTANRRLSQKARCVSLRLSECGAPFMMLDTRRHGRREAHGRRRRPARHRAPQQRRHAAQPHGGERSLLSSCCATHPAPPTRPQLQCNVIIIVQSQHKYNIIVITPPAAGECAGPPELTPARATAAGAFWRVPGTRRAGLRASAAEGQALCARRDGSRARAPQDLVACSRCVRFATPSSDSACLLLPSAEQAKRADYRATTTEVPTQRTLHRASAFSGVAPCPRRVTLPCAMLRAPRGRAPCPRTPLSCRAGACRSSCSRVRWPAWP